jgi:hypothetical protein
MHYLSTVVFPTGRSAYNSKPAKEFFEARPKVHSHLLRTLARPLECNVIARGVFHFRLSDSRLSSCAAVVTSKPVGNMPPVVAPHQYA